MKRILILFIFLSLIACMEKKESESAPVKKQFDGKLYKEFKLDPSGKTGEITASMTKKDIVEKFGEESITEDEIEISEDGEEADATIIYEDTENELTIIWNENGTPAKLWFNEWGAKWDVYGIKIGLPIRYLQEINGVPFEFYGFNWDNGGLIFNWNRGDLARMLENDNLYLGFDHAAAKEKNIDVEQFSGKDVKLSSFDTKLNSLNLFVEKIEIVF